MTDTIFALATAPGRAGVAVIRISGPAAWDAASSMTGVLPVSGRGLRRLRARDGEVLDEALVLVFEAGASFTGEPVVELQTHGAPSIIRAVLSELGRDSRLRPAEAGEFTRRAMENGRLDLAQVEGLSDLLAAESEAQRRQAMRTFEGSVGRLAETLRSGLVRAAALIEATIDFADEEVPEDVGPEVGQLLEGVGRQIDKEVSGVTAAEQIRDGFTVAIVGPPNAGKSTLLNRLAGREAALTSEVAGTTRDVIEVRLEVAGLAVTLLDTAGIRETDDNVEKMGVDRAIERATAADLRIHLTTGQAWDGVPIQPGDIVLRARDDAGTWGISGKTGAGVDDLLRRLGEELGERVAGAGSVTHLRHAAALRLARDHLMAADGLLRGGGATDIVAEEINSAIRAVDALTGRIDVEDKLDLIFSSFCIGK